MKRNLLLKLWMFAFLAVFTAKTFGQLTPVASTGLPNIGRGVTAAADFDKDGILDLIVIGQDGDFQTISTTFPGIIGIYKGNGDGTFINKTADWLPSGANALPAVGGAIIGVADYDNDGYPDFCYAGRTAAGTNIVKLLKNNNGTGFTDVTSTAFATAPTGTYTGSIEWADVDNDGDLDLLIQGRIYTSLAYPGSSGSPRGTTTQLYKNSGGIFISSPIPGMAVCYGQAKFCDFDNDGDPDILYFGGGNIGGQMVNDGTGTFTQSAYTGQSNAVRGSNMAFGDLNGDGKIDYLQSFINSAGTPVPVFKIGINTSASSGSVSFTTTTTGLTAFGTTTNTNVGVVSCVDYNNDGLMDYSVQGLIGTTPTTTLFLNNGGATPTFTASPIVLTGLHYGNQIWADFNNDGKPDLLTNGYSDAAGSIPATILYLNGGNTNTSSVAPQNLSSTITNNNVALSWSMPASSDANTPNTSLNYRYYLRTGTNQYYSGNSSSGPLVVPTQGMINIPAYTVKNLPGGTYYWSVQAVDAAYNGGAWATESSFTIPSVTPSTQASALNFANTTTASSDITWTKGNGYKRIVFISENASGSPTIANNQTYNANTNLGQGSTAGTGWYCIYNGTGTNVSITGLTEKTNYKVVVFEYDGLPGNENYNTTEATNAGILNTPFTITTQASSIVVLAASYSFDASWTNGNGAKRAVFMSLGNTGTPTVNDGQTYTANAAFGQGTAAGTGWYCVYNGTGNSTTITGLSINTEYILAVYEYNGDPGKERYLTTTALDNPFSKFTSNKLNQIISFDPLASKTTLDAPFTLTATGGDSGNPIMYTSSNTSVATISGNTVTVVGAGTTDITATQAGSTGYSDATPVTRTLTVNKVAQTISFAALPTSIKYKDPDFQLSATGGPSGNPVVFTSSDPTIASISGTTVTILGAGSVDITATQAGNATYSDALAKQTLVIAKLPQAIGFDNLANKTYLNAPFTLTATGGDSGNPVTFSANSGIVSITGSICTILGAGTVTITAAQAGSNNYDAAPSVARTLTIAKAAQGITFNILPVMNASDGTLTLTATATSGLPITYTSSDALVASISGNTVTIKKAGTISITAVQAGDVNFLAAGSSVVRALVVNKLSQTLTFDALATKLPTEADFQLNATVTSGRKISYSSSNPNVATIVGANMDYVHIVGNGTTFITASQPGDSIYLTAVPVQHVFMVGTTGVKELSEKEVSIFPNPVFETLNVNFAKLMPQTTISIYSYNGQQITSLNAVQTANAINMGNLAKGTYILKIVSPDGTLVKQIIKK